MITSLVFQNAGVATLEGGFTTLGQVFQPGALMPGQALFAELGGVTVPVQVDVRNTHPDGSVKTAALTLARPTLAPWQEVEVGLVAGGAEAAAMPVSLASVLAGHSATLSLAIEDGRAPLTIDIGAAMSEALAAGTASFWQQGPFATQARIEIPVENSAMRIVLDVTGYQDGEIRLTVGLNNDRAMEEVGGRIVYVASVTLDGETVFERGVSQGQYQRVSLDFASSGLHGIQGLGAPHEGWLNIKHDLDYLNSTNAVFPFNTEFVADPGALRYYYDQITTNPYWGEMFWPHHLQPSMGNAGGRPDIGFTTGPNANWLLSQDAAAAAFALGQAKVAGYVPWNFYDMANGTVLNTDHYPLVWTDGRGGTGTPGDPSSPGLTQPATRDTGWGPDTAHQPDLSFVPYLLTGERWIYDNLMSQGSHSIMNVWPAPRGGEDGNVLAHNQLRGAAWSMRQLDHAAWVAVDGSAEQDYFGRKLTENWSWLVAQIPEWTETWGELAGAIPRGGDRVQVWQLNLLTTVAGLSALRGSEEAREALDFTAGFTLGLIEATQAGLGPGYAGITSVPLRNPDGTPIKTWAELAAALEKEGRLVESGLVQGEGEYQRVAVSALSMAYYVTGDERFKDAVEAYLALEPPGTSNWAFIHGLRMGLVIPEAFKEVRNDPAFPTGGTFDPVTILRGTGPDEIRLSIAQDYYAGPVLYRVLVDGKDATGMLTASALKSRAEADTLIIRGDFGETVTVRVQMLNDLIAGTTGKDRNLYVNAISYNDHDLPARAYIPRNLPVDFVFTADGTLLSPAPVAPRPELQIEIPVIDPLPPKTVEVGEGPDTVVITLSQDWYLESARYQVRIDGKNVGPELEASAFRSAGEVDTLLVRGNFSDGPGNISIRFANDRLDGYGRDRNLYIESATFRGQEIEIGRQALLSTADIATIRFDLPDVTPKTVTIGEGPNAVVFLLSHKYAGGKAPYAVLVDGQEYGGRQLVNALTVNGEYDTLIVRGDFAPGTTIGLRLLRGDPNIMIHGASMDGQSLALDRTSLLITSHIASVKVGVYGEGGAAVPPPPPPPPTDPTDPTDPGDPTDPTDPPPASETLPAQVSFSGAAAPTPGQIFIAEPSVSAVYTAAQTGIAHSEVAITYRPDEVEVGVTSAWDSIKTVLVSDIDGGSVIVRNAVEARIALGGTADSTITVHDAKRGIITAGDGDNTIVVNAFSNAGSTALSGSWGTYVTLGNVFRIEAGAGNDTIIVNGWNGWTVAEIDAGPGNDVIIGSDGNDRIRGGPGDDVMTGGGGRDRFYFQAGDGNDVITDFNTDPTSGDLLMMENLTRADISWTQAAAGTLVSYGDGDSILLEGVMDGLSWSAFRFVQVEPFA
jgi:Ca2+-binding RTX toxin-like protein